MHFNGQNDFQTQSTYCFFSWRGEKGEALIWIEDQGHLHHTNRLYPKGEVINPQEWSGHKWQWLRQIFSLACCLSIFIILSIFNFLLWSTILMYFLSFPIFGCAACEVLFPWPGLESRPLALGAQSLGLRHQWSPSWCTFWLRGSSITWKVLLKQWRPP